MAAAADLAPAASGSLAYVDEEALLGFKIWVAELELLVRGKEVQSVTLHSPFGGAASTAAHWSSQPVHQFGSSEQQAMPFSMYHGKSALMPRPLLAWPDCLCNAPAARRSAMHAGAPSRTRRSASSCCRSWWSRWTAASGQR